MREDISEKNHPPPHRMTTEFATINLVHCNTAFSSGDFTGAIAHFFDAIALAQMNLVLYSNRSTAYASLRKYSEALTDVKKTVEMKSDWSKGYSRLRAIRSAWDKKGLEIDPNNEPLKSGLVDAQSAASRSQAYLPASTFGDASSGLEMWSKLTIDPTTRPYLQVMQALGVLLNVKLKGKVVGNVAYKNKDFDTSIQHYSKAIELDDEDISYIMNMAATYLEMSKKIVLKTDIAVEIRRELRSDFKMIAKSLTRKGTALVKLSKCSKDDEPAIETFQKKLNDAKKAKKELEQQEYFDLQKADEEREKGQLAPSHVDYLMSSMRRPITFSSTGSPNQTPVHQAATASTSATILPSTMVKHDPAHVDPPSTSTAASSASLTPMELDVHCRDTPRSLGDVHVQELWVQPDRTSLAQEAQKAFRRSLPRPTVS
ncbi:hypothetical protein UlMin_002573 [Ulmus minor]